MSILIFVAVFAVLAGLTVPAASRRPRIGVPGAAVFTAGAVALVPLVWVALFPLLAVLVSPVAVCGLLLLAANVRGALRARRRTVQSGPLHAWWEECGQYGADPVTSAQHRHAAFAENVAAEEAELFGGAR